MSTKRFWAGPVHGYLDTPYLTGSAEFAASMYAWEYGADVGDVVTVGWGEYPNPDYDPDYDVDEENSPYHLRSTRDYRVTAILDDDVEVEVCDG